jgi:hypothetical protein
MADNTLAKTSTLIPSKASNLPIAPVEYSQQYQDQLNNALRLYFAQVDNFSQGINTTVSGIDTYNKAYIEAYDLSSSIAITTTQTLLKPASFLPSVNSGITYDPTTGIFTFLYTGAYPIAISLNINTTAINQNVYIYAQKNTGSGWVNTSNSGKFYDLTINKTIQYVNPQAVYRVAGEQTRYYIYSNGTSSSLVTTTLPGVTPTVYVPAIRIQYAG